MKSNAVTKTMSGVRLHWDGTIGPAPYPHGHVQFCAVKHDTFVLDPSGWKHSLWAVSILRRGRAITASYRQGTLLDTPPSGIEVLESLFSDARCSEEGYVAFCSNLGYTDSRTAVDAFEACRRIDADLDWLFGHPATRQQWQDAFDRGVTWRDCESK